MKNYGKLLSLFLVLALLCGLASGCVQPASGQIDVQSREVQTLPDEDGVYTGAEELALYIHTYGCPQIS